MKRCECADQVNQCNEFDAGVSDGVAVGVVPQRKTYFTKSKELTHAYSTPALNGERAHATVSDQEDILERFVDKDRGLLPFLILIQ